MKQLTHLLKQDYRLLNRNQIVVISFIVTAIYAGVFKSLAGLGPMEKFLVLVIFNDPALLGFLFVGVMVLFEKNENTLQALAVTPVRISYYILSKSVVLTSISLLCCYAMVMASYGFGFHFVHFTSATILTTLLFSMLGFVAVAGQSSFNQYILRAVGIILFLMLPFLGYFDLVPDRWFVLFPTAPAIDLYTFSFATGSPASEVITAYVLCIFWIVVSYQWAKRSTLKNITKL